MPSQIDRLNTALAGRYHIERELGEGGMATVYLCEDVKHDRKVALKLLKPVAARQQLNELPDEMWTKISIEFYKDAADAVFKALVE